MDISTFGTVAGLSAATKLLVDGIKALATLSGRATQIVALVVAVLSAVLYAYWSRSQGMSLDWIQQILNGVTAGFAAIGLDQATKRQV